MVGIVFALFVACVEEAGDMVAVGYGLFFHPRHNFNMFNNVIRCKDSRNAPRYFRRQANSAPPGPSGGDLRKPTLRVLVSLPIYINPPEYSGPLNGT